MAYAYCFALHIFSHFVYWSYDHIFPVTTEQDNEFSSSSDQMTTSQRFRKNMIF